MGRPPADWSARLVMVTTEFASTVPINRRETQPHSLIKIRNSGGGRWYFAGSRKAFTSRHADFRILKVNGTQEPIWFYGLNLEHPDGCDAYAEFADVSNVRIYGMKSEFSGDQSLEDDSAVAKYSNVANVAQYGSGALRNAVTGRGCVEFTGANTDRVLATLIAPQIDTGTAIGDTLRENRGQVIGVVYPHVVSLYKRGQITAADEAAMTHSGGGTGGGGGNTGGGGGNTGGGTANTGGGTANTGGGTANTGGGTANTGGGTANTGGGTGATDGGSGDDGGSRQNQEPTGCGCKASGTDASLYATFVSLLLVYRSRRRPSVERD